MDVYLIAFIFGALLLFVAIIGGGFELKELKVPRVGWAPRAVALVTGLVFLGFGVANSFATTPAEARPPATSQPAPAGTNPGTVDFVVTDELGEGQVSERVAVEIDGRTVGTLTVDMVHPSASITVTMQRAGTYPYELDSTAVFDTGDESFPELEGHGSGQLQVTANRSFGVVGEILDDGTMRIALR
jgi:hypothetical protein